MSAERPAARSDGVTVSVHGPGASIDTAIEVGEATKRLLAAIADDMGIEGVEWTIGSVQFRCDGCGLLRPDKPAPDEGWTHNSGDDFCPACTEARA